MKIAIYGQYYQQSTQPIIKDIFTFLSLKNIDFVIEANFLQMLKERDLIKKEYATFSTYQELDKSFDLVLSIGGDGTILRAATLVRNSGIPILGINAGRLGFLASLQKENIADFLQLILDKKYTIAKRTVVGVSLDPENSEITDLNFAMNEVTVSRKETTSMITIETYLNGEYLNSYWADGLIISTPTGSTGYSMSCGGPIITPDTACFVITPLAPHNLTVRPLVIPDSTEVKLKVHGRDKQYLLSLDSRVTTIGNESVVTIKKTNFDINMVEIPEETFLKTLRKKLLWGEDKRN